MAGPVFQDSWLIDNESLDGGGQLNGETDGAVHMMAEWMFLPNGRTADRSRG